MKSQIARRHNRHFCDAFTSCSYNLNDSLQCRLFGRNDLNITRRCSIPPSNFNIASLRYRWHWTHVLQSVIGGASCKAGALRSLCLMPDARHLLRPPTTTLKERDSRASTCPRQQCRSGSPRSEEKDAARGYLPRNENARSLRKPSQKRARERLKPSAASASWLVSALSAKV